MIGSGPDESGEPLSRHAIDLDDTGDGAAMNAPAIEDDGQALRVHDNDADSNEVADLADDTTQLNTIRTHLFGAMSNSDVSQQTPTQVNEERDYTEFCQPLPSSPAEEPTQPATSEELRTLQPHDTGAVNFSNLGEIPRASSQISEDGGFENTRGEWRVPDDDTQRRSSNAFTPYKTHDLPPETPALPKNPFGAKPSGTSIPFAGTQLFGQTQLLSSAVKGASPTSSRPSPNVFLNSISPNVETSPLKNRTNVSSPSEMRTSSPTRPHEVPATLLKDKSLPAIPEDTPAPYRSQRDELIPESPTIHASRSALGHQPLAHYEPMKQSQDRKATTSAVELASDNEPDDPLEHLRKRKLAEKKRAMGAQELDKVSFVRSRVADDTPDRKRRRVLGDQPPIGSAESEATKGITSENALVRDSQKAITHSLETPSGESTKATPGEAPIGPQDDKLAADEDAGAEPEDEDMIPATSPVQSPPGSRKEQLPVSEPGLPELRSDADPAADVNTESSSLPPVRRRPTRTYGGRRSTRPRQSGVSLEPPEPQAALPSSESEAPVPMGTRTRRSERHLQTPRQSRIPEVQVPPTSSSLTNLSGTPLPSSKTTPGTQASGTFERPDSVALASPADSVRALRKRTAPTSTINSPQSYSNPARASRRSLRTESDSTDELHRSPSVSGVKALSKTSRAIRPSMVGASRGRQRLFEGMVFALSFTGNQNERNKLESKLTQAGATILQDGFHKLFEPWASISGKEGLRLTEAGASSGFTALLADGHSRKAKYMQALALDLPCLAPQWATACLNRGELVGWTPYLLCAGASSVLGNAIRSRTLESYAPGDAWLQNTVAERQKLLGGEKLLIVTIEQNKKQAPARRDARQQYLFLALALGPAFLSRASTVKEAGDALRQAAGEEAPFGWLYVDGPEGTSEAVFAEAARQRGGKKRRKGVPAVEQVCTARALTDEVVIQSLILGRVVEDDELVGS